MLTMSELSTNVEKAVANNVDQVPESGVLQGAGDELGEFIFIKVDLEVEGIPLDKVKVKVNLKQAGKTQNKIIIKESIKPESNEPESNRYTQEEILPVPTL